MASPPLSLPSLSAVDLVQGHHAAESLHLRGTESHIHAVSHTQSVTHIHHQGELGSDDHRDEAGREEKGRSENNSHA